MAKKIRILVIGVGNMGSSHARAYKKLSGFDLVGLVDQSRERLDKLSAELGGIETFESVEAGLKTCRPEAVAVCTYPDTHKEFALKSIALGAHVFIEKPLAETVLDAERIVAAAHKKSRKIVVGYILRQHPAWKKFVDIARTLGKPLVMRMNLNQQSKGKEWETHKQLMNSMSPIVDCGVHYVDIMCQMTRSKPVQVQAVGTRLSEEINKQMYNYGNLQVKFEDGSVGWYEAGWGPMMSEIAFFVKDVIGPKGSVSIVEPEAVGQTGSADIDSHTKTSRLLVHDAKRDKSGDFLKADRIIDTSDEPDHQELCNREQKFFYKAITEDYDLNDHYKDAINSLRIVLAADQSIRTGKVIRL
jgi:predicted dehydrogenase